MITRYPSHRAAGQLVTRLSAVRRRLSWLGVPAVGAVLAAGLLATAPAASAAASPAGVGDALDTL
jgi:hypothetical protein